MNGDHSDDNLLIARAFGRPGATASTMVGVTSEGGVWSVTDAEGTSDLEVAWPGGSISERPEIRREVVKLYRTACERLGVPAREEHAPAEGDAKGPHGGGAHGGAAHGSHAHHGADHEPEGEKQFSKVIRESSWSDHSDSEGATFMEDIMRGHGTREDYIDLVAQHYFMYVALEAAAARVLADPAYAAFHPAALVRLPALEEDLEHLIGADWRDRISPVPATEAYVARIDEVAAEGWAAGVIAHHYTRYLGDLSGGQMIAKRVAKQHELDRAGIAFYDFTELGSIPEFKAAYREALDALGPELDEAERERMLDEVRTAYHFNTAVFVDLGKRKREHASASA
ncbi:biliverdin-producing heme oxygenase [Leucobacter sp. CSA2]|uniref:Biliverdin-producing heme oxygenase n=2 Tax=Leucobacter edaphi TaxID=2796472 RepID=A0A934QC87_9MICO|nr:biliverdin-producing heme oxygenase [Leucobacter edaphi]MBK0421793.1 biliverdin-producing heme oxygenase [Leucobacter edaphi]